MLRYLRFIFFHRSKRAISGHPPSGTAGAISSHVNTCVRILSEVSLFSFIYTGSADVAGFTSPSGRSETSPGLFRARGRCATPATRIHPILHSSRRGRRLQTPARVCGARRYLSVDAVGLARSSFVVTAVIISRARQRRNVADRDSLFRRRRHASRCPRVCHLSGGIKRLLGTVFISVGARKAVDHRAITSWQSWRRHQLAVKWGQQMVTHQASSTTLPIRIGWSHGRVAENSLLAQPVSLKDTK